MIPETEKCKTIGAIDLLRALHPYTLRSPGGVHSAAHEATTAACRLATLLINSLAAAMENAKSRPAGNQQFEIERAKRVYYQNTCDEIAERISDVTGEKPNIGSLSEPSGALVLAVEKLIHAAGQASKPAAAESSVAAEAESHLEIEAASPAMPAAEQPSAKIQPAAAGCFSGFTGSFVGNLTNAQTMRIGPSAPYFTVTKDGRVVGDLVDAFSRANAANDGMMPGFIAATSMMQSRITRLESRLAKAGLPTD